MIAFITSVRHPLNSNSYPRVIELLDRTIKSVCRQTDPDFRVVVVCNEIPDLPPRDRVEFTKVDFPPPSCNTTAQTGLDAIRLDRGSKYFVGLLHAARFEPSHIMFFDADDYISRRIAAHVNENPDSDGWVIKDGYMYQEGSYFIRQLSDFHLWNGTCNILRFENLNVPRGLDTTVTQDEVTQRLDPFFLRGVLGSHPFTESYFNVLGKPLNPLLFCGAIYVTGTGENHSGLSKTSGNKRVDAAIAEDFGLPLVEFDARRYWSERAVQAAENVVVLGRRLWNIRGGG